MTGSVHQGGVAICRGCGKVLEFAPRGWLDPSGFGDCTERVKTPAELGPPGGAIDLLFVPHIPLPIGLASTAAGGDGP